MVSISWKPTVKHGLRLVVGSWKIIATSLPTSLRRSEGEIFEKVAAVELDAVGANLARIGDEPHQRQHRHALAGAGFTDDAKNLALVDAQTDAVDRTQRAGAGGKIDGQICDLEQCHGVTA